MSKGKKLVKTENDISLSKTKTLSKPGMEKLLKLRKAIFQMCHDRGYKVSDFDLNEDFEEFYEYFQDRQFPDDDEFNILLSHVWNGADKIYITFQGEAISNANDIQSYVDKLSEFSASKAIIVVSSHENIGTLAHYKIREYAPTYMFEVFSEGELLLNPMKHILSPKYTPLNNEETQQVLLNEKIKIFQLPRIRTTDPVARYFGLKKGEVIRIEEKNEGGAYNTSHKVVF